MSIKKLPKALNPKKPEEYLKMFDKYLKLSVPVAEFHKYVIENDEWENKNTQQRLKSILHGSGLNPHFESKFFEKWIVLLSDQLEKNDRIESALKNARVMACKVFIDEYEKVLTMIDHYVDENKVKELKDYLNKYLSLGKKLYDYCLSDYQQYLKNTQLSEEEIDSERPTSFTIVHSNLVHYLDSYKTNKQKYKPINDLSWSRKSPAKVLREFQEIEQKIIEKSGGFDEAEYQKAFAQRKHEEEYLDVGDGYVWWLLEGGNHPFESYIGSRPYGAGNHCGRDSSDVFFSLRTKKDGFFVSHATISAAIKKVKNDKLDLPAVFVLQQLKGPANSPIKPQLWKYVVKLIMEDEIGYQDNSSRYKSENDFHISWLIDKHHIDGHSVIAYFSDDYNFQASEEELEEFEKMYQKIITKKPWFESAFKSELRFGLLKDRQEFTAKYWGADKIELTDTFYLKYYSLEDLLSGISKVWGSRNGFLENCASTIGEFVDYDARYSEIPYDDYFLYIKNKEKAKHKKIRDAMEKLGMENIRELKNIDQYDDDEEAQEYLTLVREAFFHALYSGWEVGTQDEKYRAYENYFDGLEVENEDPQAVGAEESDEVILNIYKDENIAQGEPNWIVKFNIGYLNLYVPNARISDDQFKVNLGRDGYINFDYEYSEDAAAERLFEELPD